MDRCLRSNHLNNSKELTQQPGAGLQSIRITSPTATSQRNIVLLNSENQILTPVAMFGITMSGSGGCPASPFASTFKIFKTNRDS